MELKLSAKIEMKYNTHIQMYVIPLTISNHLCFLRTFEVLWTFEEIILATVQNEI